MLKELNKQLVEYIEKQIFPMYQKNDAGHAIEHIQSVIKRSLTFSDHLDNINLNMVYVVAAYHDVGHSIDAKNHEVVSANILLQDRELKKYFTEEEIKIMSEAVNDHRASSEYDPRSIYGKIVSSADRIVDINIPLKRTYEYRKKHAPTLSLKQIMDESYEHILEKFGKKGYATEKMYFEDVEYKDFLNKIAYLLENRREFDKRFIEINGLQKDIIKE